MPPFTAGTLREMVEALEDPAKAATQPVTGARHMINHEPHHSMHRDVVRRIHGVPA